MRWVALIAVLTLAACATARSEGWESNIFSLVGEPPPEGAAPLQNAATQVWLFERVGVTYITVALDDPATRWSTFGVGRFDAWTVGEQNGGTGVVLNVVEHGKRQRLLLYFGDVYERQVLTISAP